MAGSGPPAERHLEDWINEHPEMLGEGWTIVARQLATEAGPLDLLAIDSVDRWVVVELKRGRVHREAVAQGLDYAACLRTMAADELRSRIEHGAGRLAADWRSASCARVAEVLANEAGDDREVAVLVVGVGIDPGVDRLIGLLARYDVPVTATSFAGFDDGSGGLVLVREVVDAEPAAPTRTQQASRALTGSDLQLKADGFGVGREFAHIVEAAENAGFFCRPYKHAVMITPPSHHNRCLVVVRPGAGGKMRLYVSETGVTEFFPGVSASDIEERVGGTDWSALAGEPLATTTARLVAFLEWLGSQVAE